MNCYLVEVMVWIGGLGLVGCGVVGLWRMMDLALVIGECVMMWFRRRGDCVSNDLGRCETWRSWWPKMKLEMWVIVVWIKGITFFVESRYRLVVYSVGWLSIDITLRFAISGDFPWRWWIARHQQILCHDRFDWAWDRWNGVNPEINRFWVYVCWLLIAIN